MDLMSPYEYQIRLEHYRLNHFIEPALDFFNNQNNYLLDNMIGFEGNICLVEQLHSIGANDIQIEVDIGTTRIDTIAELHGQRLYGQKIHKGLHAFECKAQEKLTTKAAEQLAKYRNFYKYAHVIVLANTRISRTVREAVKEYGDIIHSDLTRNMLIDRIQRIQNLSWQNYEKLNCLT